MSAKPVVARTQAYRDIDAIVAWHLREEAEHAALRFIDELEAAFGRPGSPPSARLAMRTSWGLPTCAAGNSTAAPHLIFYVEAAECINVWRLLHGQRDLPALIQRTDSF